MGLSRRSLFGYAFVSVLCFGWRLATSFSTIVSMCLTTISSVLGSIMVSVQMSWGAESDEGDFSPLIEAQMQAAAIRDGGVWINSVSVKIKSNNKYHEHLI